jgi:hypothetical protein
MSVSSFAQTESIYDMIVRFEDTKHDGNYDNVLATLNECQLLQLRFKANSRLSNACEDLSTRLIEITPAEQDRNQPPPNKAKYEG